MFALKIIATVFIGISILGSFIKNLVTFDKDGQVIAFTLYGWAWRVFVIVILWLLN